MDMQWFLVIAGWGAIICVIIVSLIMEAKKTPEQKAAEAEAARERGRRTREEEQRRRQAARENAPAKGCLQGMIEHLFLCAVVMITLIALIMLLSAS